MHTPFHLNYRPTRFSNLVGQQLVEQTLTNAIERNRIANAYLLEGGRGTGKTSTARIIAKSLNCLQSNVPTASPCEKCANCKAIASGNSLDVIELDAASNNGVDDIRKLIETAQFSRMQSRFRVFIVDECQMLSRAAQGAFLKTLEEPPSQVVFILCTTDPEKLSEPIISRCMHLRFSRISTKAIASRLLQIAKLESINISPEAVDAIASLSKGGMRDALQTLEQFHGRSEQIEVDDIRAMFKQASSEQLVQLVEAILSGNLGSLMMQSQELIEQGLEPQSILQDLIAIYRDLYVLNLCGREGQSTKDIPLVSQIDHSLIEKLLPCAYDEQIEFSLRALQKSESELQFSPNQPLWLEICFLRLASSGVF